MPTIETNGIETYYEVTGEGTPVVFIHGLGLDHRLWRPQVDALRDKFETVTYDWRWHGQTGSTGYEEYSISLLADDLRALVQELELERPVFCTHSIGGLIAAEYAVKYPDDLSGIAFVESRPDLGESLGERVFIRSQPVMSRIQDAIGEPAERFIEWFVTTVTEMDGEGPEDEVPELGLSPIEYIEDAGEAFTDEDKKKLQYAGFDYDGFSPTAFNVPVLYSYGGMGAGVIKGKAERLRRAPTDVRVHGVEGAAHMLPIQEPTAVNERLLEFLSDVTAARDVVETDASY